MKQILVKDSCVTPTDCETLIQWFESHPEAQQPGQVGSQRTDTAAKLSVDIPRWLRLQETPEKIVSKAIQSGGIQYQQERQHIFKTLSTMLVDDSYVLQRYLPNQGFFNLHCENTNPGNAARTLAWMIYLNDVPDGGTRFSEQGFDCEAKQGRLVIWPAYFTHMHQGIISKTTTKYIATGWVTWNMPLD